MYSKHLLRKLGNWHTTRLIQKNIAQRTRRHFSKMLESNGAIRIQGSVYEIQNTKRIVDNIKIKIEEFSKNSDKNIRDHKKQNTDIIILK